MVDEPPPPLERVAPPAAPPPPPRGQAPGPSAASSVAASPAPHLPAWATAADLATLACALLAIGVSVSGRALLQLGPVRVSIGSVARLLVAAAALLVIRHWRHPHPALHRRTGEAWRRFWADSALRTLSGQYLGIRLSILLVGYLATASFGLAHTPFRVSDNELLNLPARWDAGWYMSIASDGYRYQPEGGQQNIAFYPAFPVLMRLGGTLLGVDQDRMRSVASGPDRGRLLWSGVLLSLVLGWMASIALFRLARRWMDVERATSAAVLLQAYPFAVFYGAPYSEALYLAGCVAAVLAFLQGSWAAAFGWGLVVGLSRPNGSMLSLPLGLLLLRHLVQVVRTGSAPGNRWNALFQPAAAAAAPGLGMLGFSALVWTMTGNPFQWAQLHAEWGRQYQSLPTLASDVYDLLASNGLYGYSVRSPIDALNLAAAIFGLAAVYPVWRRFGGPLAVFQLATVVPPLLMGGAHLSLGRITSTAFPAFMWLAAVLPAGGRRGLILGWAALQGLAAALFFTWRPLF